MELTFAKSGWRTGVTLFGLIIFSEVITFISAHRDWRTATNLLGIISFALLAIGVLFGLTANIGRTGRVLWVFSIGAYLLFLGVEMYRFNSPGTPD